MLWVALFLVALSRADVSGSFWWYYEDLTSAQFKSASYDWKSRESVTLPSSFSSSQDQTSVAGFVREQDLQWFYTLLKKTDTRGRIFKISRISLDGTVVQDLVDLGTVDSNPYPRFVVDSKNRALWYFTNQTFRCGLNGLNCITIHLPNGSTPCGMELNPTDKSVYVSSIPAKSPQTTEFYKLESSVIGIVTVTKMSFTVPLPCVGSRPVWLSIHSDGSLFSCYKGYSPRPYDTVYVNGQHETDLSAVEYSFDPFNQFFVAPNSPQHMPVLYFIRYPNSPVRYTRGRGFDEVPSGSVSLLFLEGSTCKNDCSVNGVCENGACTCNNGYYGSTCERKYCFCNEHGTCDSFDKCVCDKGWVGVSCQEKEKPTVPPIFPADIRAFDVVFNGQRINYYINYESQRRKFQYVDTGLNVTELYDLGFSFSFGNGPCTKKLLVDSVLERWQVSPTARLVSSGVQCARTSICNLWQDSQNEWLVNQDLLPVKVNISEGSFSFDPTKIYLQVQPSDWSVPGDCK